MAIDLSSDFNIAARGCFQEASAIFQSIDCEFAQWQDSNGQNAKNIVDGERKQFQTVIEEARTVKSALHEIEELAENIENISRKRG